MVNRIPKPGWKSNAQRRLGFSIWRLVSAMRKICISFRSIPFRSRPPLLHGCFSILFHGYCSPPHESCCRLQAAGPARRPQADICLPKRHFGAGRSRFRPHGLLACIGSSVSSIFCDQYIYTRHRWKASQGHNSNNAILAFALAFFFSNGLLCIEYI